jgi:hypothetical protein
VKPNPYAWQLDNPRRAVPRGGMVNEVVEHLRRGAAVKVIGGRGMGKSVLLKQIEARLRQEPGTSVVRVPGPPEEATVPGAVHDLAARLGVRDLSSRRMDELLERVLVGDVMRIVVLCDEADDYVADGARAGFARSWFNKLEVTRKEYDGSFDVVFAGGLGLFYLAHEIGSGIVSRAESCVLDPFSFDEMAELAAPFAEDGRPLDEACLVTIEALSGGSPALATYGMEELWREVTPGVHALERIFGLFRERSADFIREVRASVSQRGRLDAPWRVLEVVRENAGAVPSRQLREACVPRDEEQVSIDPEQALKLLRAAGLVRLDGSPFADPVQARPVASILNLPEMAAGTGEPIERFVQDVAAIVANLHRFGRDFHEEDGLLHEELYSSVIAVGLRLLGWRETDREAIQAAGFADIKVRLVTKPGLDGHVIVEAKIWRSREHNEDIQKQVDDYRIAETLHGVAVTLGERGVARWPEVYEEWCLGGLSFERLQTPRDLVGRWLVKATDADGRVRLTDHLLVQIPKRR